MMEMGITEGRFEFGADNRRFVADPENKVIYPSLLSIKSLSQRTADGLYRFAKSGEFHSFYDVYKPMMRLKSMDSGKLNVLIKIGYFNRFGGIKKILKFMKYIDMLYERSQFSKDAKLPSNVMKVIEKFSDDATDKQFRKLDYDSALAYIWERIPDEELSIAESMKYEFELLGYTKTLYPEFSPDYVFVQEITRKFKNPKVTICRLCNGDIATIKVKAAVYDSAPFEVGDIIRIVDMPEEGRWFINADGDWEQDRNDKENILKKWRVMR